MIKVSPDRVILERITLLLLNWPELSLKFLIWRVNRWRFQIFSVILQLEFFLVTTVLTNPVSNLSASYTVVSWEVPPQETPIGVFVSAISNFMFSLHT